MKKVLCVLAAIAMVAAVTTSCNKKCTCKTYVDGKEMMSVTVNLEELNKQLGTKETCKSISEGDKNYGYICK
ncbi:MAG: hypothetical protein MJZ72_03815 [Bacteroidales bacterium]|nr:hypothetical protein [Bacteroidales bacterium]